MRSDKDFNKSSFFSLTFEQGPRRYKYYHQYLRQHLKPHEHGLSIGSGLCINELKLQEEGYDILCTDIKNNWDGLLSPFFPDFRFQELDIVHSVYPKPQDYVIALSVLFFFDKMDAIKIFNNVAKSLNPRGRFILDLGGGEDNLWTTVLDNFFCPWDSYLQFLIKKNLLRKKVVFYKKHQGYRYTNRDVIDLARQSGFRLDHFYATDYVTELKDRLLLFSRLPEKVIALLGRSMPYVRLFNFVKEE